MVVRTRELELSLGAGVKRIEENEKETVILQRRSIRAVKSLKAGHVLSESDMEVLRPCPADAIPPYMMSKVVGKRLSKDLEEGAHFTWTMLVE